MSIKLTNLLLENHELTSGLTQSEKHILMIFCYRADEKNEAWSSVDLLIANTNTSENTINRALKKLRDKKYLIYTGKFKGKMKKIPVYSINLNSTQIGGDLNLIIPKLEINGTQIDDLDSTQIGDIERSMKDNKEESKPFSFLTTATPTQKAQYHEYVMRTKQDILLNILPSGSCVMTPDEWLSDPVSGYAH